MGKAACRQILRAVAQGGGEQRPAVDSTGLCPFLTTAGLQASAYSSAWSRPPRTFWGMSDLVKVVPHHLQFGHEALPTLLEPFIEIAAK